MDIKNNLGLIESLLARANNPQAGQGNNTRLTSPPPSTPQSTDIVSLSNDKLQNIKTNASKLVSEDLEKVENGFRRTQTFETAKGGTFTRVEEQTTSDDRSKRLVIQQNENGSTTVLENILDRQDNGAFRQTQRFTNEVGETSTNIEFDIISNNAAQIFGLPPTPTDTDKPQQPFGMARGTQYDVVT